VAVEEHSLSGIHLKLQHQPTFWLLPEVVAVPEIQAALGRMHPREPLEHPVSTVPVERMEIPTGTRP
jgi:hypothetical protein